MSEDVMAPTTETLDDDVVSPADESAGRTRGRPRPLATIKLDEAVLTILSDGNPRTRRQLAEALAVEKQSIVYLALYRLRLAGRVRRVEADSERFNWTVV